MLMYLTALNAAFSPPQGVDDALLARIGAGDMDAFHRLYELASGSVYGFALSITKHAQDAEDVLQDTFLTVHRLAGQYQPMGRPMAWLYTIARNCALQKLRTRGRTVELDALQTQDHQALSRIQAVEDRALVEALLELLDSQERQIVMLHAASGLKNREIAQLLELPLNTVLSKYHRAIKKLRRAAEQEAQSK